MSAWAAADATRAVAASRCASAAVVRAASASARAAFHRSTWASIRASIASSWRCAEAREASAASSAAAKPGPRRAHGPRRRRRGRGARVGDRGRASSETARRRPPAPAAATCGRAADRDRSSSTRSGMADPCQDRPRGKGVGTTVAPSVPLTPPVARVRARPVNSWPRSSGHGLPRCREPPRHQRASRRPLTGRRRGGTSERRGSGQLLAHW